MISNCDTDWTPGIPGSNKKFLGPNILAPKFTWLLQVYSPCGQNLLARQICHLQVVPMPMQVVPPVDLCIRCMGYYSYGPNCLGSIYRLFCGIVFDPPCQMCESERYEADVEVVAWQCHGSDWCRWRASAPLPPDGHIPPPASSSDPAQQFRHSFLAQSIFSVTQYTLQDVGALYDKCLIYFSAKVGWKWKWSNGVKDWNESFFIYYKQYESMPKIQWKAQS